MAQIVDRQVLARQARESLGDMAMLVTFEELVDSDSTRQAQSTFLSRELDASSWHSTLKEPLKHGGGGPPWQPVRGQAT